MLLCVLRKEFKEIYPKGLVADENVQHVCLLVIIATLFFLLSPVESILSTKYCPQYPIH